MNIEGSARSRWTAAVLALLLAGCALTVEQKAELDAKLQVKADPALFKREPVAPELRLPLKLALFVPPSVAGAWAVLPIGPGFWMTSKKEVETPRRLQASSIVEQALLKTLSSASQGECHRFRRCRRQATISAGYSSWSRYSSRTTNAVDVVSHSATHPRGGLVGQFEASTRLHMQLKLVDAQGHQVWTRDYDDGSKQSIWDYPTDSTWLAGIQLAAHDAAWRLSQQVLRDLRDWQAAERVRSRVM